MNYKDIIREGLIDEAYNDGDDLDMTPELADYVRFTAGEHKYKEATRMEVLREMPHKMLQDIIKGSKSNKIAFRKAEAWAKKYVKSNQPNFDKGETGFLKKGKGWKNGKSV